MPAALFQTLCKTCLMMLREFIFRERKERSRANKNVWTEKEDLILLFGDALMVFIDDVIAQFYCSLRTSADMVPK